MAWNCRVWHDMRMADVGPGRVGAGHGRIGQDMAGKGQGTTG